MGRCGETFTTKICFDHISETDKARDLIFGTVTPYDLGNEMLHSGHQVEPPPPVALPIMQKNYLDHTSETNKARDLIFEAMTCYISQRLINLET